MEFIIDKQRFGLKNNTCDGKYTTPGLDVYFGTTCPNNCSFCIAKYSQTLNESIMPWGQKPDVDAILESLHKMCNSWDHNTHLSIHGGEPLMWLDELNYVLDHLPSNITNIRIQSSLPKSCLNSEKLYEVLSKVERLIVSVHHPDPNIHAQILNSNENHDRIEWLRTIKKTLPNLQVEVNTVVTKDIFHKGDVEGLIAKCGTAGIDCLRLTEVKECESKYIAIEDLIDIDLKSPYAYGCEAFIKAKEFKNMNIIVRRNCFKCNSQLYAGNMDVFKAIIKKLQWILFHKIVRTYGIGIFPNGELYNT